MATLAAWSDAQPWLRSVGAGARCFVGDLTPGLERAARSAGTGELYDVVAGGVTATRAQLLAALLGAGFTPETARMTAATCPIWVRTGPNQYRLRGTGR
ncbi:MAG: hypothetical protein QOI76_1837 [Frankiales bacterium]|jgi:hypothetical protein|nr:hypothetical protein [Frankiales bacterium]